MRKLLWTCIATGLCAVSSFGAIIDFKNVTFGVFNTGIVSNVALLGSGIRDDHYVLIPPAGCTASGIQCQQNAGGTPFGPETYVIMGPNNTYPLNGAWPYQDDTVASANATQWIGPRADQTNPQVGGSTWNTVNPFASASAFYLYRANFNLSLLGVAPGTQFTIQLKWLSDNPNNTDSSSPPLPPQQLSHIDLCNTTGQNDTTTASCGNTVATGNPGQTAAGFGSTVTITGTSTSGWQSLDFIVFNSVVTAPQLNPTGLRVQIVSALAGVPEPATFGLMSVALLGLGVFARRKH